MAQHQLFAIVGPIEGADIIRLETRELSKAALVSLVAALATGILQQMRQRAVLGADSAHPYFDFRRQPEPADRAESQGAHFL